MFRIWKKILRIIAIILPCFLVVFISNNVSAVSVTGNIPSNSPLYLCGNDTGLTCYNYLHLEYPSAKSFYNNVYFNYTGFGVNGEYYNGIFQISPFISDQIYTLNFPVSLSWFRIIGSSITDLIDSDYPLEITMIETAYPGQPSGSITLTENGTYDVTSYAEAVVDVPATIVPGDYHDDLISIRNVIIIGAGVILVIYFFYMIYGIIIKPTGGER